MNRSTGLLFASERLRREIFTAEDADFVGRNFAKAKLALGDVVLAMRGQYHYSCVERHKRLKKLEPDKSLSCFSCLAPLHEQGLEFKLHPRRDTRHPAEFQPELRFLKDAARELWLTLESRRLGRSFSGLREYAMNRADKCPETRALKNRLINLRQFGAAGLRHSRYPRHRLLCALPLLLWDEEEGWTEPVIARFLKDCLRTRAGDFRSFVFAYEKLWRIYN